MQLKRTEPLTLCGGGGGGGGGGEEKKRVKYSEQKGAL